MRRAWRRSFNASNYLLAMSEFLRAANASVNAQRLPGTASVRCVFILCCSCVSLGAYLVWARGEKS